MGTEIQMAGALHAVSGTRSRSAIRLSAEVSAECLAEARIPLNGIQQLIYSGIYRDHHIGEPSIASLVHGSIGDFLPLSTPLPGNDHPDFFCFDISNGGCGWLQGIQLADAFIRQGRISRSMVVAGDAPASNSEKRMFPFTPAASAILLGEASGDCGFKKFHSRTYPDFQTDFTTQLLWTSPPGRNRNSHVFSVSMAGEFISHCVEAAEHALKEFFQLTATTAETFDLYVTTMSPCGFSGILGDKTGVIDRFILPDTDWGQIHTAGPGFGLRKAWINGSFKKSGNILFLAVGSGLTVTIAWYQKERNK